MPAKKDLTGQRFGKLIATRDVGNQHGSRAWECMCDCGRTHVATASNLGFGSVRSCGCTHLTPKPKHGHARAGAESKTYMVWKQMVQRCTNPANANYHNYGGRGISICVTWLDFVNFLADMGEAPEGRTIERIDNDDGYNKQNCRWATWQEQASNKRNSRHITVFGETKTMSEWARHLGVNLQTLSWRINEQGTDPAEAVRYYAGERH